MNETISLAMIVRDEEADLERCLNSVKDYVDEIVIVDTGSKDKTVEVAKKFTDKVFFFEWIDDFAAARNFSFSKCTKDFIFWVDADDVLLPEDGKKIRNLDLSDKDVVVFDYIYSQDEYGNYKSIVPRERIIRRSLNLQWENEIHEIIPLQTKYHVDRDIKLHHYRNHVSSSRNIAILERIVNNKKKNKKKNPRNIYYLGKEYFHVGKIDEAIKVLHKFVKCKDSWWENKYEAMFYLAKCYLRKNMLTEFKKWIFEGLKIEERIAEPYYLMGDFYFNQGQWLKAIHWYKICLSIDRSTDLLATYNPEFTTWSPHLQLCLAYNNIGNVKQAVYHNSQVFKYRKNDERAINNRRALNNFKQSINGEGIKLNLGCGGKTMEGYVNVDIFPGEKVDKVFDLDDIPYADNSISAINSEHSLEHVGWDRSNKALHEWYRVLQPGGELLLKMPDLEQCCKKYIETPVSDIVKKDWYKYTIYGIQRSQSGEPDEAQTHISGYSKDELANLLTGIGFVIDYCEHYDGWDTPSVGIRALKPVSNIKIGWIAPIAWNAAQVRVRVLNVNRWLRSKGYMSDIVDYRNIINENYDVAIVGKGFDEHHYKNIKMLKQYGKTVYCDLCEDIINFNWVTEILQICDKVICCSHKLAEKVQRVNHNTLVIEDAYE